MLDRKTPPSFRRIERIDIPGAEKSVLDNGIPVYSITSGKQPVVRLEVIFRAGSWHERNVGASYFATKMLAEGTTNKTSSAISNEVDKYGAFIDLSASLDYAVITLECLSKHLESLLPLLYEIIYDSTFPGEEFENIKHIKAQQLRINNEKNNIIASKKFREALFGSAHPYGKELSEENIKNLKVTDVQSFYRDTFFQDFSIVLSGQPSTRYLELINKTFGGRRISTNTDKLFFPVNTLNGPVVVEKAR